MVEISDGFPRNVNNDVDRMAILLFDTFKEVEPNHPITKYPMSYVATFVDMARAALRLNEMIRKENELSKD